MSRCPCGLGNDYASCCQKYIDGVENAPTAEALMRSRFSAYALSKVPYVIATCHPNLRKQQNPADLMRWCQTSEFKRLEIMEKVAGNENDEQGRVRFIAWVKENDKLQPLHEFSDFEKVEGKWTYKSGQHQKTKMPGPNTSCPCGSGKKFKKCCG